MMGDVGGTQEFYEVPRQDGTERQLPVHDGWGGMAPPQDVLAIESPSESPPFDLRGGEPPDGDGWGDVATTRLPPRLEVAGTRLIEEEDQDGGGAARPQDSGTHHDEGSIGRASDA